MIAFACKGCGRKHTRSEDQAGALVFCNCGQALRVPWIGEAEAVSTPPIPLAQPRPILDAQPVPHAPPAATLPSRSPRRLRGKVNPNFCFHHDDNASTAACAACHLPFCDSCVVLLRGETVCGACKNFRVASPGRARRVLPLAAISLVAALASGPVALTLSLAGAGVVASEGGVAVGVALCLLGAALPAGGLSLAGVALGRLDRNRKRPGEAWPPALCACRWWVWCGAPRWRRCSWADAFWNDSLG